MRDWVLRVAYLRARSSSLARVSADAGVRPCACMSAMEPASMLACRFSESRFVERVLGACVRKGVCGCPRIHSSCAAANAVAGPTTLPARRKLRYGSGGAKFSVQSHAAAVVRRGSGDCACRAVRWVAALFCPLIPFLSRSTTGRWSIQAPLPASASSSRTGRRTTAGGGGRVDRAHRCTS